MKAIETVYKGYKFRSRLEARWAVFFDELGIKYYYEKEGFDLDGAGWYLPDFWIPRYLDRDDFDTDANSGVFVEIKPTKATESEFGKAHALATKLGTNVFIFQGDPYPNEYEITVIQCWDLGALPEPIIKKKLHFDFVFENISGFKFEGVELVDNNGVTCGAVFHPLSFSFTKKKLHNAYLVARQARF